MDDRERIAKAALAEIPADGAILLDADLTTYRLAEALPTDRELTVVTNSVTVASTLTAWPNLTLMLLGGRLRPDMAAVDDWSLRVLRETYVDVAFIGTGGLSVARGLTTTDEASATMKRAVIAAARRVVVLTDHTTIGIDDPVVFGSLPDIDTIITDSGVDPALAQALAAAGPQVIAV
jgi:DeoR family transcriptional regulator, fructose operon transcriptional repressor